jgi:hypothetical protein
VRLSLALAVAAMLAAAPAASAQELSREQPISVAGETISLDEIRHWARISAQSDAHPRRPTRNDLLSAAQLLIHYRTIALETRAVGIRVTPREVSRELRGLIHTAFESWRGFHAYLRDYRQTFADVRWRVRLDLLSNRLRERVISEIGDTEDTEERFGAWLADFNARWRAQTLCTPRFAMPRRTEAPLPCGNGPAS